MRRNLRRSPRRSPSVALLLVPALLLAACDRIGDDLSKDGAAPAKVGVVRIGVLAPLSGPLSPLGLAIRNSVDLAVDEANASERIPGWKIELVAEDDTATPEVGADKAASLVADAAVAGVVGTLNDSVAAKVQPVLAAANLAIVSPAASRTELTRGPDAAAKARPYGNFFSLSTTQDAQGPFAADFATDDLDVEKVVTIHDGKVNGRGLVDSFSRRIVENGAAVSAAEVVGPSEDAFTTVLGRIRRLDPDLIFYGGEYPQGQLLTAEAEKLGVRAPIMGGDGLFDPAYIDSAKQAAEGDLSVSVAATAELTGGGDFLDAYGSAKYPEPPSAFGAYAYDAANVLIAALATVLDGRTAAPPDLRPRVVAAVQATDIEGATGRIAFDELGESAVKVLSVYRVTDQRWTPIKTDKVRYR